MVEYTFDLNAVFGCLADETRRDIIERISLGTLTVGEIADEYDMSLAAVSKHLKILERADLIIKRREGRRQHISIAPLALKEAGEYLEQYRQMWQGRYDKLDMLLQENENE